MSATNSANSSKTLSPESQISIYTYSRFSGSPFTFFAFPSFYRQWLAENNPLVGVRITAAGTAPELHRIPFSEMQQQR